MPAFQFQPIKVLIVDDQEVTRIGVKAGIERECNTFHIIGEAENGENAVKMALENQPDIILMDIFMPIMDGISATKKIKKQSPNCKVIIFTGTDQHEQDIAFAFSAGADAYCKKDIKIGRLVQIMEMVNEGAIWIDPAIAKVVMTILTEGAGVPDIVKREEKASRTPYNTDLTAREAEVLALIVRGMSNKEIANALELSINTVKTHVKSIIQKMAVEDRTQAAIKCLENQYDSPRHLSDDN